MSRDVSLLILLAGVLLLQSCKEYRHEEERDGSKIYFHGHELVLEAAANVYDTSVATDPVTDAHKLVIVRRDNVLTTIDRRPIYRENEADRVPKFAGNDKNIYELMFNALEKELGKLPDGRYLINLDNVVIDKKGDIAYCFVSKQFIRPDHLFPSDANTPAISEDLQLLLYNKALDVLEEASEVLPAILHNEPVDYILPNSPDQRMITVKSNKAILEPA